MSSAFVTVQDGAASPIALPARVTLVDFQSSELRESDSPTASGFGLAVTPGNTIKVALADAAGVLGWKLKVLWTNGARVGTGQFPSDTLGGSRLVQAFEFQRDYITLRQAPEFDATFTISAEGTGFILEAEIVRWQTTSSIPGLFMPKPAPPSFKFALYCGRAGAQFASADMGSNRRAIEQLAAESFTRSTRLV